MRDSCSLLEAFLAFSGHYPIPDINSTDFFDGRRFVPKSGSDGVKVNGTFNVDFTLPVSIDRIVKISYSSLLADLGQASPTVMSDKDLLFEWADDSVAKLKAQMDKTNASVPEYSIVQFSDYQNAIAFWKNAVKQTGNFHPNKSTIYTQYQCEVPQLKSTGALIMALILTDLVFLRALWWIFNQSVTWWLQRSDPRAMFCEGCSRKPAKKTTKSSPVKPTWRTRKTRFRRLPRSNTHFRLREGKPP